MSLNQRMFQFSRFLLIVGISFYCFTDVFTQITQSDRDSLELLIGQKNWEDYNKKLFRLGKRISKDNLSAKDKSELLYWIDYLVKQKPGRISIRVAYMNFANVIKYAESFVEATPYLLIAHAYVDDPFCLDKYAWYIENPLAINYNQLDELEKSEYFYSLVVNALIYFGDSENLARTYTNLGTLKQTKGNYKDAENYFKSGLRIANRINKPQSIFANATGLGELYTLMDSIRLVNRYQEIAFEQLYITPEKNIEENKRDWHRTHANYLVKLGNYEEAICYFNTALEYYSSRNFDRLFAKICIDFGTAYLIVKDFEHSREFLEKAIQCLIPSFRNLDTLPKQLDLYQENTLTEAFSLASNWYSLRYEQDKQTDLLLKSVSYLELGLFGYEMIQGAILTAPSKLKIIGSNRSLVDRGIAQLYQLKKLGVPPEVLFVKCRQFFSYSKGILLGNKIFEMMALSQFSKADKLQISELERQEFKLSQLNPKEINDPSFILGQRIRLQQQKRDLFGKYSIQEPVIKYPENYIEYQIIQDTVYVMAQLKGESYFQQIGTYGDLQKIIEGINSNFNQMEFKLDEALLKQAYHFLLAFIKNPLPERICIIPDGQIQFVPFDALIHPDGQFLISHSCIYFAQRYGEPEFESDYSDKSSFILAIRPEYPENKQENLIATRGNVSALLYTQEEVDSIQMHFDDQVEISKEITVDELPIRMQSAEIVHFAGHAKASGDSAYLILPGDPSQFGLDQLASLHSPWRMVVLSACETGLGEWEYGEGIRSLGKSFQEAGAESVIMSLWSVNDESSAKIMSGFYKELKEGKSKDEALRNAKLDYLQNAGFEKKHPYYWAGFVGYGEMKGIETNSRILLYLLIGLSICFLIYILKKLSK